MSTPLLPTLLGEGLASVDHATLTRLGRYPQAAGHLCSGEFHTGLFGLGEPGGDGEDLLLDRIQDRLLGLLLGEPRSGRTGVSDRRIPTLSLSRRL
ncbi:hypothetical protein ACIGBH_38915 [Streptomyces sp. NPDC085929]|uniref:hypothetical protein n=1 Tax=Streptomyces sp. NPDC085929 TaxID=3365739 RepID=UPI0037D6E854